MVSTIFAACYPNGPHPSIDAKSGEILKQSQTAMGIASLHGVRFVKFSARVSAFGLSGNGTQWTDLQSGHFAEFFQLPPLAQDDGYDGTSVWSRDYSGLVADDGSVAGRSQEINTAYVGAYGPWMPNAAGAEVHFEGVRSSGSRSYDLLRAVPPGSRVAIDLWFDSRTHLLNRWVQRIGPLVQTTTFADYRRTGGLLVPRAVHEHSSDGNDSTLTIAAVSLNPPNALRQLSRPESTVRDFSILNGASSTSVPFDLVENHVYIQGRLNGKGPYRFIFDTGGQNIIDPAVLRDLAAAARGTAQQTGVGASTESSSFARIKSLEIGSAVVRDQVFTVLPVRGGFGITAGAPVDGVVGWEVLSRFVTTFDYANHRVALALRTENGPADPDAIPFVFNSQQPQVACNVSGVVSDCTIDTGARNSVTIYSPFAHDHPAIVPARTTSPGVNGFGVGGPAVGRLGRLQSLRIGPFTFHGLVADFSDERTGALAVPFVAANIGGNLLRRFAVTFDYRRQVMTLRPNRTLAQPDFYDRSGLFIIRKDGEVTVADARPGTPAASAHIAKGDTIRAIDGKPARDLSLEDVRRAFLAPSGTPIVLTIFSKRGVRSVKLVLRDYV
ncbi:MAG TPA: aspartyl protease family protein [Candidatus Baltobacteraceae bacterium]|jgi:hypothetical protein|nr:aspartyl protease family protein [Candidatus Baltobacteraceae bacterium]